MEVTNIHPLEDEFIACGLSGKFQYSISRSLGYGSNGSCLYEGKFEGDPVAIKRIPKETFKNIKKEMLLTEGEVNISEAQILRRHVHSNVIRYFAYDHDHLFIYLALELCKGNLAEYIENGSPAPLPIPPEDRRLTKKHLVQGILEGMDYLHRCDIIHGDLKPQNILLRDNKSIEGHSTHEMKFNAVISDFGHSLKIDPGKKSISAMDRLIGTEGWRSKEVVLRLEEIDSETKRDSDEGEKMKLKVTKVVDIFAFGCIIQYVMAETDDDNPRAFYMHPFGNESFRNKHIKDGARFAYLSKGKKYPRVLDVILADLLIGICVDGNRQCRPNTKEIKDHPFFWKPRKRYLFIENIANSLTSGDDLCELLNKKWGILHKESYKMKIENAVKYINDYNSITPGQSDQRCKSIYSLLKDIRNIKQHYHDIKRKGNYKALMSDLGAGDEDDFDRYFLQNIVQLVPIVYTCHYTIQLPSDKEDSDKEDSACIDLRGTVYWKTLDEIFPSYNLTTNDSTSQNWRNK